MVSGVLNGALNFVPVPLPFIEANKYDWKEHQIDRASFKSDCALKDTASHKASRRHRCQAKCMVRGKNSLTLPETSNVYGGLFTIDYQEKDLKRSLFFRIPADAEINTVDTITVERN